MSLSFDTRTSDSSWISTVWTCASEDVAMMRAVASETWGLVFWSEDGSPQAAVVGPQSRTSVAPVPSEAIFVGIEFKVGTSLRIADTISIVDAGIACPMRDLAASGSTGVGGLPGCRRRRTLR